MKITLNIKEMEQLVLKSPVIDVLEKSTDRKYRVKEIEARGYPTDEFLITLCEIRTDKEVDDD